MNRNLDYALCRAFPNLYKDRGEDMRSTCMCWGFCCGEGWFKLIWDLSTELEALIILENKKLKKWYRRLYIWYLSTLQYIRSYVLPNEIISSFYTNGRKKPTYLTYLREDCAPYSVCASQVKEKYGTLRFYMTAGSKEMYALINKAEKESANICDICGDAGEVVCDRGWYRAMCKACIKKANKGEDNA